MEGLQPVWLEVVDWKVQALDVVRQVSKFLDVASHEVHQVHEVQHPDVVAHEGREKRRLCPL